MKSESFLTLHRHNANESLKVQEERRKDIVKIVQFDSTIILWSYENTFCAKKTKLTFSEDEGRSYEFVMTWHELIMTEFSYLGELSLNETQNTWAMFEQIIPLQYFFMNL